MRMQGIRVLILAAAVFMGSSAVADDLDRDSDGFSINQWDCNDYDPDVHPEAFEICRDGIDQNCDGVDLLICIQDTLLPLKILTGSQTDISPNGVLRILDANDDGRIGSDDAVHALNLTAGLGGGPGKDYDADGFTAALGDRNDRDPTVYPGAQEICGDGIDQDCDGGDQPCPEDLDADQDWYSPDDGDCNDQDFSIYPGSDDVPGDGIDQNCDGCDAFTPAGIVYANETFSLNEGAFSLYDNYSVSAGRFIFDGNNEAYVYKNIWNGGSNPSNNFSPTVLHSNYFENYRATVDAAWLDGDEYYGFGLFFSSRENLITGGTDYLMFSINKFGRFLIHEYDNNEGFKYIDGGYSFLLTRDSQTNTIAVEKEDTQYRFYIDGLEVKRLVIEGFGGGGVGIISSDHVDVAYDNFRISTPQTPTCNIGAFPLYGVRNQNEFLYRLMTSVYLWHDQVPALSYDNYSSTEALLEDLVYPDRDRWSYITYQETYDSHFEDGKYVGYGFSWKYDGNNDVRVRFVYPGSPAEQAGMRRGDKFLEVNGKAVSVIEYLDQWSTILGPDELDVAANILLESVEGDLKFISMTKSWVDEKSVLHSEIKEIGGVKIGYLVLKSFIETTRAELDEVFTVFNGVGIDELIVDLRYNGGGRISVANYLASLLGGTSTAGDLFYESVYNVDNQHRNYSYHFSDEVLALSLNRLFIISTSSTASASEALYKGLSPHIETVLIGATTYGKPVGSNTFDIGDKYISAIQFVGRNTVGDYSFYDGLVPDCLAEDGLIYQFGDMQEPSLQTAIDYISSGQCPVSSARMKMMPVEQSKKIELKGFKAELGAY